MNNFFPPSACQLTGWWLLQVILGCRILESLKIRQSATVRRHEYIWPLDRTQRFTFRIVLRWESKNLGTWLTKVPEKVRENVLKKSVHLLEARLKWKLQCGFSDWRCSQTSPAVQIDLVRTRKQSRLCFDGLERGENVIPDVGLNWHEFQKDTQWSASHNQRIAWVRPFFFWCACQLLTLVLFVIWVRHVNIREGELTVIFLGRKPKTLSCRAFSRASISGFAPPSINSLKTSKDWRFFSTAEGMEGELDEDEVDRAVDCPELLMGFGDSDAKAPATTPQCLDFPWKHSWQCGGEMDASSQ